MRHYPASIKAEVIAKLKEGRPLRALSREYGISRWAIYTWTEQSMTKKAASQIPKNHRGRPRKTPITTQRELEIENKRLKMEVDLLRSFLQAAGRR
jgi:transposase